MPTPCLVDHAGDCDKIVDRASLVTTLHDHGVRTHSTDGSVYVYEEATILDPRTCRFTDASKWIPAPTTIHGLAAWLGY